MKLDDPLECVFELSLFLSLSFLYFSGFINVLKLLIFRRDFFFPKKKMYFLFKENEE